MSELGLKKITLDTPLGTMIGCFSDMAVRGLWFAGQKYFPRQEPSWPEDDRHPLGQALKNWLREYFAGHNPPVDLPLEPGGTPFQQAVWQELRQISYGCSASYGFIADTLAKRSGRGRLSAQAVGGAVGHNPLSVLIPCHRVLSSKGALHGYAGGLDRKEALLRLESRTAA
ncbi:MAG: methylated-DNA--[protein]-cysteine S-methyltransferase [Deltaproteobacteria bacterium]|jgi:methylated-DNA-[protein]-cysteine S-methyltransferase|nr:methylated-DNA--[protein]-cysteine S-methyltransferase [Deltaproteobacteria bacterium]